MDVIVNAYNLITRALGIAFLAATAFALYNLIFLCLRWKTPQRSRFAKRLGFAILAAPCFIAVQQALLWWVLLPAMGRRQLAEIAAHRERTNVESAVIHLGDASPVFSVTDIDGMPFSVGGASGEVIVINFFATWCGPCLRELPDIDKIWTDYRGREHFRLVVIGREESADALREYRNNHSFTFPIAPDLDRSIYSKFAKELIPRTIVISPSGEVVYSKSGFDEKDIAGLRATIEDQLAGAEKVE